MAINFRKHQQGRSAGRNDKDWKPYLKGLSPSQCCDVVIKRAVESKNSTRVINLAAERHWFDLERPYYNVWPSVFQMIEEVDLDVPIRCLTLPFDTMAMCFADGTKHGLATCLASVRKMNDQRQITLSANIFLNGEIISVWRTGLVKEDESFAVFSSRESEKYGRISDGLISEQTEDEILKLLCHLFCGVSILSNDATIVQPIVLNRDLMKYKSADEATKKYLEERAARINGRGFSVGENLEAELKSESSVSPHIRKPHMALFWTGKGRITPVLKLRRGAYVHRSEVTQVPTGFMDRELQIEEGIQETI